MKVIRMGAAAVQATGDCAAILGVWLGKRPEADRSPGVAVVMGAQVLKGGRPSATLRARTLHAAGMYASGRVERVVVTGGLGEHPPTEAGVMAGILKEAGVPEAAITEEPLAENTWGSAVEVSRMMRGAGVGEVVVVTDPLHCVRTVAAFGECGLAASPEAVYGSPSWRVGKMRTEQLFREMGAAVWYRFRHGVGSRTRRL